MPACTHRAGPGFESRATARKRTGLRIRIHKGPYLHEFINFKGVKIAFNFLKRTHKTSFTNISNFDTFSPGEEHLKIQNDRN